MGGAPHTPQKQFSSGSDCGVQGRTLRRLSTNSRRRILTGPCVVGHRFIVRHVGVKWPLFSPLSTLLRFNLQQCRLVVTLALIVDANRAGNNRHGHDDTERVVSWRGPRTVRQARHQVHTLVYQTDRSTSTNPILNRHFLLIGNGRRSRGDLAFNRVENLPR